MNFIFYILAAFLLFFQASNCFAGACNYSSNESMTLDSVWYPPEIYNNNPTWSQMDAWVSANRGQIDNWIMKRYWPTVPTAMKVISFTTGGRNGANVVIQFERYVDVDTSLCNCMAGHTPVYKYVHISTCGNAQVDPKIIDRVECFELGKENPLRPFKYPAVDSGIYVRIRYIYKSGDDTVFTTVLSHGCKSITVDGDTLEKGNAHDDSTIVDGATSHRCLYNGEVLLGTCVENGLDTGCGGQLPFDVNASVDSIINPCRSSNDANDPSSYTKSDTTTWNTFSEIALTKQSAGQMFNRIDNTMKLEGNKTRADLAKLNDELKNHTTLLESIKAWSMATTNAIKKGFSDITGLLTDSSGADTTTGGLRGMMGDSSGLGSSDTGEFNYDTGSVSGRLRGKYLSDSVDTIVDTSGQGNLVDSVFSPFKVYFGDENCDCDPDWLIVPNVALVGTLKINICPYNLNAILRPILLLIASFFLFVFYRDYFIKVLLESF